MPDPIEILRSQGLSDSQIRSLAESGQAPSYLKNILVAQDQAQNLATGQQIMESNKAIMESNKKTQLDQENLDLLRKAQGEYELGQQRAQDFGIPSDFGRDQVVIPPTEEKISENKGVDPALLTGVPVSTEVPQSDKQLANQYLTNYSDQGFARALKAIGEEKVLAKDLGERQAQLQEGYNEEALKLQEKQNEIEEKRQIEAERLQSEIDQDIKEIGDQKIDPGRFWANKTTSQKILAGLSLALSGFAQGYSGAPNVALQMLDKAMNDDILAQKSEFQSKRSALEEKRNAYSRLMGKYNSELAAFAGTKAAAYERFQGELKAMAARKSGTQAAINAEKMIAELEIKKAEQQQKLLMEVMKQKKKTTDEMREYYVPNKGYAFRKSDAEKLSEIQANQAINNKLSDDLISKINDYGISDSIGPSQLRSDLKAAAEVFRAASRGLLLGVGTVQQQEYDRLVGLIPSGASANPLERREAQNALRSIKNVLNDMAELQYQNKIEGYQGRINMELGKKAKKVK